METSNFNKIVYDLWHISRAALATVEHGNYERKQYIAKELRTNYPDLVADLTSKRLWLLINDILA